MVKLKKVLLCLLVVCMAAVAVPLSSVSVDAEQTVSLSDGLIVPSFDNSIYAANSTELSSWWSSHISVTAIENSDGLTYAWKSSAVGPRNGVRKTFSLSDLILKFSSLTAMGEDKSFGIILSGSTSTMDAAAEAHKRAGLVLAFDASNGQIRLENEAYSSGKYTGSGAIVLLEDDKLKYDNIIGKEFTVSISGDRGIGYTVSANVGGEVISGSAVLTEQLITSQAPDFSSYDCAYVMLTSLGYSNGVSVNYLGIGHSPKNVTLTAPSTNLQANQNYWSGSKLATSDIFGGGLNLKFTDAFVNVRMGINKSVKLDGLRIQLDNLSYEGIGSHPVLAIVLKNDVSGSTETYDNMFSLVLHTGVGLLRLCSAKGFNNNFVDLISNDALKYTNLQGKPITLTCHKAIDESGGYTVNLYIGSQRFNATISADNLSFCSGFNSENDAYVTFMPGTTSSERQYFSVDVLEVGNEATDVDGLKEKINSLSESTAEADLTIVALEVNKLSAPQQFNIGNVYKLNNLLNSCYAAQRSYMEELSLLKTKLNASTSLDVANALDSWSAQMSVSDAEYGIDISFTNSIKNIREGYIDTVNPDGLTLTFNNLRINSASAKPTIYIGALLGGNGSQWGTEYNDSAVANKTAPLALVFDTVNGSLTAYPGETTVIENNDCLKTENLSGRFTVGLSKQTDGTYIVKIKTGNNECSGTVPAPAISGVNLTDLNGESVVMLTSWESTSTWSITFEGVHEQLLGDANGDKLIDIRDLVRCKIASSGLGTADMENLGLEYSDSVESEVLVKMRKTLLGMDGGFTLNSLATAQAYIDNSKLIPAIMPTSQVTVDSNGTPDWVNTLIIGEMRVRTATAEGTLEAAVAVLDHYAEMGINGIWLTPLNDPGTSGNGYTNLGPATVDPAITGTENYTDGWKKVKEFIDEAHKRNIRVLIDVVSWGTTEESPLYIDQDTRKWYQTKDGQYGKHFDWTNAETSGLKEYFVETIVSIANTTGCDGFRLDAEPLDEHSGYEVYRTIRSALKDKKLFFMSECVNNRTGSGTSYVFDTAQSTYSYGECGYENKTARWYFLDDFTQAKLTDYGIYEEYQTIGNKYNIVDTVKNGTNLIRAAGDENKAGTYKYYLNTLTCHDHKYSNVRGNRLAIGYQAIFSPFIPCWYIGEEWNNSRNANLSESRCLYFNTINWDELDHPENRAFYEDVKRMIRVRRENSELFTNYTEHFYDSNITELKDVGVNLDGYARYNNNSAILVIPNYSDSTERVSFTLPLKFDNTDLSSFAKFTITDAETGELLFVTKSPVNVTVTVEAMSQRIVKIYSEN